MENDATEHAQFLTMLGRAERTLARRDEVLRGLIRRYGPCTIRPRTSHFETLLNAIVSQQLSTRAAATIFARFQALDPVGFPHPATILATPDERLREVGLSFQKISYIRDLATRVGAGELPLDRLAALPDDEVVRELTAVKGIGIWTAQMFLIFSLGRFDVFPVGDLGIRKAIRDCFGFAEIPSAATMEELAVTRRWAPWRSIASWYLWRSLENK